MLSKGSVSYTHLDVYKRQPIAVAIFFAALEILLFDVSTFCVVPSMALLASELSTAIVPVSYTHLAPWYSVEWYKKGAILNQPTAFGINPMTGAAMVGGEAGPEAVAPIDTLMNYVKTAVKEETTGTTYYLERLISMLSEFFPSVISNMDRNIVLSDGTLVGAMTPQILSLIHI